MRTNEKLDTKKMTMMAMLSAIAILLVTMVRIPAVAFLYYEPKDVAIVIGGFLFGPLAALMISIVVSFVEMFTVSADGFYGLFMNIIASSTFACTAAFVYKRNRTLKGAVIGLIAGVAINVPVMLLWNYLIVPFYLGVPREVVAGMLIPIFLPFNLIKGVLNAAFIMMIYKPFSIALKKSGMFPSDPSPVSKGSKKKNLGVILVCLFAILTCVLFMFVLRVYSSNENDGGNVQNYYEYNRGASGDYYDE